MRRKEAGLVVHRQLVIAPVWEAELVILKNCVLLTVRCAVYTRGANSSFVSKALFLKPNALDYLHAQSIRTKLVLVIFSKCIYSFSEQRLRGASHLKRCSLHCATSY